MSTRRSNGWQFDHGAQYFTGRDARFLRHVVAWRERGLVRKWQARIPQHDGETRYVAVPGMSAVCSEVASGLADIRFEWSLHQARFENGLWLLESTDGARLEADALVMTAPPPQARALIPVEAVERALQRVEMLPGWAVMAVLDRPLAEDWDARFVDQGPLGWLAGQSSRPGRPDDAGWVLHATPEWSLAHLDLAEKEVCARLLDAARQLPGATDFQVEFAIAHRWRYARAKRPLEQGAVWIETMRLALAGDWCHGSRVEGAFLSGAAAAGRIMTAAHGPQR
jgi:renalase